MTSVATGDGAVLQSLSPAPNKSVGTSARPRAPGRETAAIDSVANSAEEPPTWGQTRYSARCAPAKCQSASDLRYMEAAERAIQKRYKLFIINNLMVEAVVSHRWWTVPRPLHVRGGARDGTRPWARQNGVEAQLDNRRSGRDRRDARGSLAETLTMEVIERVAASPDQAVPNAERATGGCASP